MSPREDWYHLLTFPGSDVTSWLITFFLIIFLPSAARVAVENVGQGFIDDEHLLAPLRGQAKKSETWLYYWSKLLASVVLHKY